MAAGRRIDRSGWPGHGAHRTLLEVLARVHEDNGCKSLREVALGMNLVSRSRVSSLLRGVGGALPADEHQLTQLVRALGGGADEIAKALPLYRAARVERIGDLTQKSGWSPDQVPRMMDSEPRVLGVHPAITTARGWPTLPPYVSRDVDEPLGELVASATGRGGFILLVGQSSVGKTRTLYEVLRQVVPEWSLLQPADTAELRRMTDEMTPRTVLWLDELQHFLAAGLAAGDLRALRRRHHPLIIVATLWPMRYQRYSVIPPPGAVEDPYQAERELLNQAEIVTIDSQLSDRELHRARVLASVDARIQTALDSEYGMTQALAAAPALVQRWDHAPERYIWALLTAAIDACRIGIESALSADLLRDAVPDYLTPTQQAKAPTNWFEEALSYATKELHGAVAALMPVGAGMGMITGYTVADYLLQYGAQVRRRVTPPRSAWEAYRARLSKPTDLMAAARAAEEQSLPEQAESLLRAALGRGNDPDIRSRLAVLLDKLGRGAEAIEVWRAAVDAQDPGARLRLTLALQSDARPDEAIDVWRAAADAGDSDAHLRLALMLIRAGRADTAVDALRRAVAAKVEGARGWLASVLQDEGLLDEAIEVWRQGVTADEDGALEGLAVLLQEEGRQGEGVDVLRRALDKGVVGVRPRLAELLHSCGLVDEALDVWREGTRHHEPGAHAGLALLLEYEGRTEEAITVRRDAVAHGDDNALRGLAETLERTGRNSEAIDAWRIALRAGLPEARLRLTFLLQQEGQRDECIALWREASADGDPAAGTWLTAFSGDPE